jgi:hypothetical protein
MPRGTTIHLPIPFDQLSPSVLFLFLHYLYYPTSFVGTENDWKNIRTLCLEWDFPRIAGIAMLRLLEIRQEHLPPVMRQLTKHIGALEIYRKIERRNRLYEVQIEDDDENLVFIEDE